MPPLQSRPNLISITLRSCTLTLLALAASTTSANPALAYRTHGRYHRSSIPVPYTVNPDRMPYGVGIIHQAARNWSNKQDIDFAYRYAGSNSSWRGNGNNVYMDRGQMGGGTLGMCWWYSSGSYLSGFDIALNGSKRLSRTRYLNVITHEFGHALGLLHSRNNNALMIGCCGPGDYLPDLHSDDIAGARSLYGARSGPAPTPDIPGSGATTPPPSSGTPPPTVTASAPEEPELIAPRGEISDLRPDFQWRAVSGADSYELAVDRRSNGRGIRTLRLSSLTGTAATPNEDLQDGTSYHWWVRAVNTTGKSDWAGPLSFNVVALGLGKPSRLRPTGSITQALPTFEWDAARNASHYELVVTLAGDRTRVIHQEHVTSTSVDSTSALQRGKTYHWWVRAHDANGHSGWASASVSIRHTTTTNRRPPRRRGLLGALFGRRDRNRGCKVDSEMVQTATTRTAQPTEDSRDPFDGITQIFRDRVRSGAQQ